MAAGKVEVLNWYGTWTFYDHLTACAYFGVGSDLNWEARLSHATWADGVMAE